MKFLHCIFKGQSRFFTLIELLVVVSIVSTLASIGLTNMNSARSKAADSHLKESLSSLRNQAQLYYTTNGTYGTQATTTGLSSCTGGVFGDPKMRQIITSAQGDGIGPVTCIATDSYYTLSVPLKSNDSKSWCVSSLGFAGMITGTIANNSCSPSASESVGTPGCVAAGACPFTMSGSSCISYSASSSPSTCDYVSQTSTCTNGAWDGLPFDYPTCTPACVTAGGCSVTDEGGTCVSYASATPAGTCASVAATSTCTGASWSPAPHANATCTEGCPASGGCAMTADGGTCTTYTAASVISPTTCASVAATSTCSGGVWSVTPAANASCSAVMRSCTAPDGSTVAHNGTWLGYSVTSVVCGSLCPAKETVMQCVDGSWSGTAYNTCSVTACLSCAAAGGCPVTAHGGSCTSYSASSLSAPANCSSVAQTSTCSDGSWNPAPYANASCVVNTNPSGNGGTITYDGDYKVHTFTSSGTFTVATAGSFDVLMVGGGGGGSNGGGGAGGLIYRTAQSFSVGSYPITIGGGGGAGNPGVSNGSNGGNTTGFSLTANGGGGGGAVVTSANSGGSGGGTGANSGSVTAGGSATQPSSPSSGYGSAGGANYNGGGFFGGPGGGAGGSPSASSPAGGAGRAYSISGSSITYAVGGNGGQYGGSATPSAGTANRGNGGGGGYNAGGASGGSGVVIIRYKYQ